MSVVGVLVFGVRREVRGSSLGMAPAIACRAKCLDPPEKAGEYDDSATRRMAEAAIRDPSFCRELASPRLALTRCVDSVEVRVLPTSHFGETAALLRTVTLALEDQKPTVDVALLFAGSEPEMKLFPPSPWPGHSMYAPGVDGSAHCTLTDGGYEDDLHVPGVLQAK